MANNPEIARLRTDPALAQVFEDLERSGPSALGKYMNDPVVMQKLSSVAGSLMGGAKKK